MKKNKLLKSLSLVLTASMFFTSLPVTANTPAPEVVSVGTDESVSGDDAGNVTVEETEDGGTLVTFDDETPEYKRVMPDMSGVEKAVGGSFGGEELKVESVEKADETDWNSMPDICDEYIATEDLATLNYKEIADEQLSNILDNTSFYEIGGWLSTMSESELDELLERNTPLNQEAEFLNVGQDATDEEISDAVPYTETYYKYALDVYKKGGHKAAKKVYFGSKTASFYVKFNDTETGLSATKTVKISSIDTGTTLEKTQKVVVTITDSDGSASVLTKFGVENEGKTSKYTYASQKGKAKKFIASNWTFNKPEGYIVACEEKNSVNSSGSVALFADNKGLFDNTKKCKKLTGAKLNGHRFPTYSTRDAYAGNGKSLGYPNVNNYADSGKVKVTLFTNIAKDGGAMLRKGTSSPSAKLVGKKSAYKNMTYVFNFYPNLYSVIFDKGSATTGVTQQINGVKFGSILTPPSNIGKEYCLTYDYNDEARANHSVFKKADVKTWNIDTKYASLTKKASLNPSSPITGLTTAYGATLIYRPVFDEKQLSVTTINPTRTGYTFDGWFTQKDGGTKAYDGDVTFTLNADMTLYAHWTPITYSVSYMAKKADGQFYEIYRDENNTYDVEKNLVNIIGTDGEPTKIAYAEEGQPVPLFVSAYEENDNGKAEEIFRYNGSDDPKNTNPCTWNDTDYATNHSGYRGTQFKAWCTQANLTDESYGNGSVYKNLTSKQGTNVKLYLKVVPAKSSLYVENWRQRKIDGSDMEQNDNYTTDSNYYVSDITRLRELTGSLYQQERPYSALENKLYENKVDGKAKDALGQNIFSDEDEELSQDWNSYDLKSIYTNGKPNEYGLAEEDSKKFESVPLNSETVSVVVRANDTTLQQYIDGIKNNTLSNMPTVIRYFWKMRDYRTTATVRRYYQTEDGEYHLYEDGDFDWEAKGFDKGKYPTATYKNKIIEGWAGYKLVAGSSDKETRNRLKSDTTYQKPSMTDDFAKAFWHEDDEWYYYLIPEICIKEMKEDGTYELKEEKDITYSDAVLERNPDENKTIEIYYHLIKEHKAIDYNEYHMYEVDAERYDQTLKEGGKCCEKDGRYYVFGGSVKGLTAEYGEKREAIVKDDVKEMIKKSSMLYFDEKAQPTTEDKAKYSGSKYVFAPQRLENGEELDTISYAIDDEVARTGIAYVLYDRTLNEVGYVVNDYLQVSSNADDYELLNTRVATIPYGETITVTADESLIAQSNDWHPNNTTVAEPSEVKLIALDEVYLVTDTTENSKDAVNDTTDLDSDTVNVDYYSIDQSELLTEDDKAELKHLLDKFHAKGTKEETSENLQTTKDGVTFCTLKGNAVNMYYSLKEKEAVVQVHHLYKQSVEDEEYNRLMATMDLPMNVPVNLLECKDDGCGGVTYTYASNEIVEQMNNKVEGYRCVVSTDEDTVTIDSTNMNDIITFYYDLSKENGTFTVEHIIPSNVEGTETEVAKTETFSGIVGTDVTVNPSQEVINILNGKFEGYKAIVPSAQTYRVVDGGKVQIRYLVEKGNAETPTGEMGTYTVEHIVPTNPEGTATKVARVQTLEGKVGSLVTISPLQEIINGLNSQFKGYKAVTPNTQQFVITDGGKVQIRYTVEKEGSDSPNPSPSDIKIVMTLPDGTVLTLTEEQMNAFLQAMSTGSAFKFTINGVDFTIVKNPDGSLSIKLVSGGGQGGKVVIPTSIKVGDKVYTVTTIADGAFKNNKNITEVVIPSSITRIGASAFEGCTNLKTVRLYEGLVSIGAKAFKDCTSLTNITLPKSLKEIGASAFENCKSLKTITIPVNVLEIGAKAFKNCTSLETVRFASGCKLLKMGKEIFSGCVKLKKISLPAKLTAIPAKAFKDCKALKSVTIGKSVATIGDSAFENCKKIKTVTIPSRVSKIGKKAFYNCSSLKKVSIKTKVLISIGSKAFKKTKKGIKFHIPSTKTNYINMLKNRY